MSVNIGSNTYRDTRWTAWKTTMASKGIAKPQYDEDDLIYTIWGYDGPEVHICQIWKGSVPYSITNYTQEQNDLDKTDFETNYKSSFNQSLQPVSSSGSPQVDISGVSIGTLFNKKLRYTTLTANQSISNSAFTTVYTYNGSGILCGIYLELNWSTMNLELIIDGEKVIDGLVLEDIPICGSGNSGHGPSAPFIGRLSAEEISIQPPAGIRYDSSVVVKLQSSTSGKKLISGYMVLSKET